MVVFFLGCLFSYFYVDIGIYVSVSGREVFLGWVVYDFVVKGFCREKFFKSF